MAQSHASSQPASGFNARKLVLAIVAAAALNLVIYGIGSAAGATWIANGQTIVWFLVIVATIVPMAIGALITWLLARRWVKAMSVMAWVGLALGVITVPAPLLSSGDGATGLSLAAMHAITGVAWFVAIRPRRHASVS